MLKFSHRVYRGVVCVPGGRKALQVKSPCLIRPRSLLLPKQCPLIRETRKFSTATYRHDSGHTARPRRKNQDEEDVKDASSVQPDDTVAPQGKLSIVFTDIVKSTAMWEKKSEAMATAMQTHDDILRSLTQAHRGYEVKQNGDGFMIAFATAVSALQFCLAAQQQLLDQEWPEELLRLSPAREVPNNTDGNNEEDDGPLFRGLSLRMSAHWGEPMCNWNDVVRRMDYLGPMVNRAARFIQVAEGGQIVVSDDFLHEIRKSRQRTGSTRGTPEADDGIEVALDVEESQDGQDESHGLLGDDQRFEIRLLGRHQFKGLSEPQKLYFIVPQSLTGRVEFWGRHNYVPGSKGNIFSDKD